MLAQVDGDPILGVVAGEGFAVEVVEERIDAAVVAKILP